MTRIIKTTNTRSSVGSTFEDFLEEQGLLGEVTATAVKRVVGLLLSDMMKSLDLTKADMARRIGTSRAQLDRLLDPENDSVSLATLARAAKAVGRSLKIELA